MNLKTRFKKLTHRSAVVAPGFSDLEPISRKEISALATAAKNKFERSVSLTRKSTGKTS